MSFYEITGGRPLEGAVAVQGAKNSVLPILAAALLAPGVSVIHNCPDLTDVNAAIDILRLLGCSVTREGDTVTINAASPVPAAIPERLSRELRSSVIFMGAILSRMGAGELAYPGGCDLGPRPIDLHLSALRMLGADIREEQGQPALRLGPLAPGAGGVPGAAQCGSHGERHAGRLRLSWGDHHRGGRP